MGFQLPTSTCDRRIPEINSRISGLAKYYYRMMSQGTTKTAHLTWFLLGVDRHHFRGKIFQTIGHFRFLNALNKCISMGCFNPLEGNIWCIYIYIYLVYERYMLSIGQLYATYHLLPEPEFSPLSIFSPERCAKRKKPSEKNIIVSLKSPKRLRKWI